MISTRLLAVLIAVMLAAVIVKFVIDANEDKPAPDGGATAAETPTGEDWPLHQPPPAAPLAEIALDSEKTEQLMEHERGTKVEPGKAVSLDVAYQPGSVNRYRCIRTTSSKRKADDAVAANRFSEGIKVTVLEPDGKGRTRVRIEQEWFLMQMLAGPMNSWEYDSRSPDEIQLALPQVAMAIKPLLAIQSLPLVYTLDKAGHPIAVEGIEAHQVRWRDALEQLGVTRADDFLPTEEQRLIRARGTLFPPGLGGTLVPGKTRDYARREDTNVLTHVTFDGKLHVTHSDENSFAVGVRDVAVGFERTGGNTLPGGQQIADVRVTPAGKCDASWVFERTPGRLRSGRIHIGYELWVAFPASDAGGGSQYDSHFMRIEQLETIDLIEQSTTDEKSDDAAGNQDSEPDRGTDDARKPVDTDTESSDNDASATPK